jgi:hypothetical protein
VTVPPSHYSSFKIGGQRFQFAPSTTFATSNYVFLRTPRGIQVWSRIQRRLHPSSSSSSSFSITSCPFYLLAELLLPEGDVKHKREREEGEDDEEEGGGAEEEQESEGEEGNSNQDGILQVHKLGVFASELSSFGDRYVVFGFFSVKGRWTYDRWESKRNSLQVCNKSRRRSQYLLLFLFLFLFFCFLFLFLFLLLFLLLLLLVTLFLLSLFLLALLLFLLCLFSSLSQSRLPFPTLSLAPSLFSSSFS